MTITPTSRPRVLLQTLLTVSLIAALAGCSSITPDSDPDTSPNQSTVNDAQLNSAELSSADGYSDGDWVRPTEDVPAVTKLSDDVRDALARVIDAAAADGRDVNFSMTAGWRSQRYQQHLFDQAVMEYGSTQEASRWVKLPGESEHERGEAIDFATADAMDWLTRFGAEYGFCQVYANEAWHFELTAKAGVCPALITDSSAR